MSGVSETERLLLLDVFDRLTAEYGEEAVLETMELYRDRFYRELRAATADRWER